MADDYNDPHEHACSDSATAAENVTDRNNAQKCFQEKFLP